MDNMKTFQYRLSELMDDWDVPHGHWIVSSTEEGLSVMIDTIYVHQVLVDEINYMVKQYELNGTAA